MAFTAAELQKKHELEGTPDPFPSIKDAPVKPRPSAGQQNELDTESQVAFPSLAPSPAPQVTRPASSAWGVGSGPRIRPSGFNDSFTLSAIELSGGGRDGKQSTLGEVTKQIMNKFKVKIEASTNQKRQTIFYLKSESQKELDKAKRQLLASLSPIVQLTIDAPVSTIGTIIGPKGANLKQIRDKTGIRVDIPRKDAVTPSVSNGHSSMVTPSISGTTTPIIVEEDDQEPTVQITINGPKPLALEAQGLINEIIASKTANTTQRIRDIPANVLPFITPRREYFEAAAEGGAINMALNVAAREITVSGSRDAVLRVVEAIRSSAESFKTTLSSVTLHLPKRQHRLLVGKGADEIMASSKCAVIVPKPEEIGDEVLVWGKPEDLPNGLSAVMTKSNSAYIHEFPLPGPITLSRQILTYIMRVNFPKTLTISHPNLAVYTPPPLLWDKSPTLNIELVGEKSLVDDAIRQISELLGKLIGSLKEVPIDWLLHRIIAHKNAKKLKQFHDIHNVIVFFPPESTERSSVLIVYDPTSPTASPSPVEKTKHLEDVENELLKLARDAADVKSQAITVDKKWHDAIVGKSGTTLNAIIGEDKALSIKIGAEVGNDSGGDVIFVRGVSSEVDRAIRDINRIVENVKNDEIDNGHSVEFDIDKEYVGRIVGSGGASVNKLRDSLGVAIFFDQDADDAQREAIKKKKAAHQKSHVKITGRKENVEEAKRRILSQVDRLADETSEVLKIPNQYHSSLIGQSGRYVLRLEEKYSVKITFPRDSTESEGKTREVLKSDEVLVKGGKKGVANAKAELLEALEYEKESNNSVKFTVPARSVARILGKGGVKINEIKDNTNTQIDVDKSSEELTTITVRGTKQDIAEAKAAILAISDAVAEEASLTILVDHKYHRSLIGAGGQGLKELIARCGGPSDPKLQAGLVRFPRQGEPSDEVRLRGEPKLVNKLKAELEKVICGLRDRVVLGIEIPSSQHRTLIGRGGQNLNDFQAKFEVMVQFPGSRSYAQAGEPENVDEIGDGDAANIVKVSGSRAACSKAIHELKSQIKSPAPEGATATVSVPLKYHHAVTQQGIIFRTLRSYGVHVEHSKSPPKATVPSQPPVSANARIDDVGEEEVGWQIIANYQDVEDGDSEWTLKGRDQTGLERARKTIEDAIANAEKMTHVGFLTMPNRSMFPRIVGAKGSNVSRLRAESGADITVSREDSTIVISGSEQAITAAKDAIIGMTMNGRTRGGRD